jgi:hypothetical protein
VSGEQDLPFKSDEVDPDSGKILLFCAAIFCTTKPSGDARSHSTDSAQPLTGQTMSIAYCGVTPLGAGLGPFFVGILNERLFGGGATLDNGDASRLSDHCNLSVARSYFAFTPQSMVAKPTEIMASGVRQG